MGWSSFDDYPSLYAWSRKSPWRRNLYKWLSLLWEWLGWRVYFLKSAAHTFMQYFCSGVFGAMWAVILLCIAIYPLLLTALVVWLVRRQ